MSQFRYTHAPNSRDGYDYVFVSYPHRTDQSVFDWCVVQFGKPDGDRDDHDKKWSAGSWSYLFAHESDALWFKMWFC